MNIAIAFASLSGNTVTVSLDLQTHLVEQGHAVTTYDLLETSADTLKQHELVFLGSSTYGDGELNPIAEMFVSAAQIEGHTCDHTKFALFSLGDSSYPQFAKSGELIAQELAVMGASLLSPILTLDGFPDDAMYSQVRSWAEATIATLTAQRA